MERFTNKGLQKNALVLSSDYKLCYISTKPAPDEISAKLTRQQKEEIAQAFQQRYEARKHREKG